MWPRLRRRSIRGGGLSKKDMMDDDHDWKCFQTSCLVCDLYIAEIGVGEGYYHVHFV